MIYLLAQMVSALALAAVCGGAVGWLIHRSSQGRQVEQLRQALYRQQQQMSQLQSDVSMLTDDYDELQRRTQDEITDLREENQKIPFLTTNLEKSQLLVRQMLQKHEAKVRDLNHKNQSLGEKLKAAEDREQAHKKQQADLDRARREAGQQGTAVPGSLHMATSSSETASRETALDPAPRRTEDSASAEAPASPLPDSPLPASPLPASPLPDRLTGSSTQGDTSGSFTTISNSRNTRSWASAPLEAVRIGGSAEVPVVPVDDARDEQDDLDAVHVVEDDDIRDIQDFVAETEFQSDSTLEEFALEDDVTGSGRYHNLVDADTGTSTTIFLDADVSPDATGSTGARARTVVDTNEVDGEVDDFARSAMAGDASLADPFDQVIEVGDDLQRELTGDAADQAADGRHVDAQAPDRKRAVSREATASFRHVEASAGAADSGSADSGSADSGSADDSRDLENSHNAGYLKKTDISGDADNFDYSRNIDTDDDDDYDDEDEFSLFDPVEQRDDLQQIYGIGPATEKALNDLGITSFAQLAMLKHHEIETIASALHIVPGRIERDNWVGNARRQLEDVLEQL